jgi:hypothetical protein
VWAASRQKRTIGKAVAMSADDPEADLVRASERAARPCLALLEMRLDLFDSKLLCHAVTDMTFVRFACR